MDPWLLLAALVGLILTTLLTPICILSSWEAVQTRVREYMIAFLVLETLMVGTFSALDLVLFYLFFEGGLIPMFLIIGVWGGPRRVYASFKFFLYTLLGSVLMLLAIMAMYWQSGTTDITVLLKHSFPQSMQPWLWFAFFASFAVKMPMWPVHTWLPDAHVEAPTGGSVVLAAIMLKMGGYGFIRFSLPITPDASASLDGFMIALSLVAVVYIGWNALYSEDMYNQAQPIAAVRLMRKAYRRLVAPKALNYAPAGAGQGSHREAGAVGWTTRASHIFRARDDTRDLEPVLTGGMDNPVDVVFTPSGERILSCTFLVHPGGGQRDGLIHALYGGVYGKENAASDGHPRTGDLMPIMTHMGAAAPSATILVPYSMYWR